MKQAFGIWLPDADTYFESIMARAPMRARGGELVGTYQYQKVEAALAHVSSVNRRVALDIGAHVGFWSMWLSEAFEAVHAFEPVAEHVECFRANVRQSNVTLHACAVGSKIRTVDMKRDRFNSGQAHVSGAGTVPMITIDGLALANVDFIKIDVEGYEPQVISGASETISRCKPVIIVEQKGFDARHGNREGQALEMLLSLGMSAIEQVGADYIMGWN
jgi:FkbM family methyltransferase